MGRDHRLFNEDREPKWYDKYISPIPPHLTPEEREVWEKEIEWERKEVERRKKEGFWKY